MAGVFLRVLVLSVVFLAPCLCWENHYVFNVKRTVYTTLCESKSILTVNDQFPGPTLYAHKGDTLIVDVINQSDENITIHWHGVKQPRNPWYDGPEYITQCPIRPGSSLRYIVKLSTEEGTAWWHAHSTWARATVHGAIVVYPPPNVPYPFPSPHGEHVIILAEWWKKDVREIYSQVSNYTAETPSDAYTINGKPGFFNNSCGVNETRRVVVEPGKTYLLRIVNAAMTAAHFFGIDRHVLTVVGSDGAYTKPFTTKYIVIHPGETMDVLLHATHAPHEAYVIAASPFTSLDPGTFDNFTATAILQYSDRTYPNTASLRLPKLPKYNNTHASTNFIAKLRSLASEDHPALVPVNINHRMLIAVSLNRYNSSNSTLAASLNNISFVNPPIDILDAYWKGIGGTFQGNFDDFPARIYNFTGTNQTGLGLIPGFATRVKFLEYGESVEMVLQGTSLVQAEEHPMHLHGFSFYVVARGSGNFDYKKHSKKFNLVDPPLKNTIEVPRLGWVVIRFKANNPGVWFFHCHFEQHLSWGMNTVFIVKNGHGEEAQMLPRPGYMPPCRSLQS